MQHRAWRRAVADPTCGNRMMLRNSRNGARRSGLVGFRSTRPPRNRRSHGPGGPDREQHKRTHLAAPNPTPVLKPDSIAHWGLAPTGSRPHPSRHHHPKRMIQRPPIAAPTCLSTRALRASPRPSFRCRLTLRVPPPLPVRIVDRPPGKRRRSSSPAERPMTEDLLRSRGSPGVLAPRGEVAQSAREAGSRPIAADGRGSSEAGQAVLGGLFARCRERTRWRTTIRGRGVFLFTTEVERPRSRLPSVLKFVPSDPIGSRRDRAGRRRRSA